MAVDNIKFKRGPKEKMPRLTLAEPGFATDELELYIGTLNGNEKITSRAELALLNLQLETKVKELQNADSINKQAQEQAMSDYKLKLRCGGLIY